MTTPAIKKSQTGFGLLQVAILLMIIGGLASYMLKPLAPQAPTKANEIALNKADKLLRDFVAINGRLPCVDTNGDGVEDCSSTSVKGGLPYVTIGMASAGFVAGDSPIKYGVYRKANNTAVKNGGIDRLATSDANAVSVLKNDADLAVLKNRYQPTMAGGYSFNFTGVNNQNALDFCQALNVGEAAPLDTTKLYVQTASGARKNVAYALSMGGRFDGSGNGTLDDGLNASSTVAFNSSGTLLSSNYDDYVISRSFSELKQKMQCDVTMQSLNMMANSVLMEKEVKDQAEDMADAAVEGAIMAGVGLAVIAYDVVLASVDLANASVTLGVASGLLSGAIASCAVLVGCALIPVYTASVVAASIGIALSGVAVGAAVAAGVAQAVATGLYVDIAIRSNAAIPPDVAATTTEPDYTDLIASLTTQYNTAVTDATNARNYANQMQATADAVKATSLQRFSNLYSYANTLSYPTGGNLPDTYASWDAYNAARANLENKSEAYQDAIDTENNSLIFYRDKAQIAAGYKEDCDNTACVFDPPLTQEDIDALPSGGDPSNLPSCPSGGTPDLSSQSCIDYAAAKIAEDNAYAAYIAAKTASNNAYNAAYDAAQNHPVYIPQVTETTTDSEGKTTTTVTQAATTRTCASYNSVLAPNVCALPRDASYAMGDVVTYHNYGLTTEIPIANVFIYNSATFPNSYMDAILVRQPNADLAVIEAEAKESTLADVKKSLDGMICKQAGKYWDNSAGVCSDNPPPGYGTGSVVSNGGSNILQEADRQGVFR